MDLTLSEVDEILNKRSKLDKVLDIEVGFKDLASQIQNPDLKATIERELNIPGAEIEISSNYGNDLSFYVHAPQQSKFETMEELQQDIDAEQQKFEQRVVEELRGV